METKELNKIAEKLQELDYRELLDAGLKNINGGFAKVDMYDHDEDFIYVEIQWGVQCGGDSDYCHSENGKLNRKTLEWS